MREQINYDSEIEPRLKFIVRNIFQWQTFHFLQHYLFEKYLLEIFISDELKCFK